MEREGRKGEEAAKGSGRDKEKKRDKSWRRLFLMNREEREVLILAQCARLPCGENIPAEHKDAKWSGVHTDTQHTH